MINKLTSYLKEITKGRGSFVAYLAITMWLIVSYIPAIKIMNNQDAWLYAVDSDITVNFLLLFYFWGYLSDLYCKKKGWSLRYWKGWLVWGVGLIAIILFFNLVGGYTAIWNK